ncbi:MAG: DUF1064 domain-containing protein [Afipia felis]|nr:DUF1064 domain-containing protein [Afipia felis]
MKPFRFDHRALGRLAPGIMNKTEAAYAQHLDLLVKTGDVLWYRFEGLKFRLADKTFLTPDFVVMTRGGLIELHDVKGFMMDDANVKMKVAADQYPFEFFIIRKRGSFWMKSPVSHRVPAASHTEGENERAGASHG